MRGFGEFKLEIKGRFKFRVGWTNRLQTNGLTGYLIFGLVYIIYTYKHIDKIRLKLYSTTLHKLN